MEEQIVNLRERVAVIEHSLKSSHIKIDLLNVNLKEDIAELKNEIKGFNADMKLVLAFIERSKGMAIVVTIGAAVIAWIINFSVSVLFHK